VIVAPSSAPESDADALSPFQFVGAPHSGSGVEESKSADVEVDDESEDEVDALNALLERAALSAPEDIDCFITGVYCCHLIDTATDT
jgi:hypothetical protein